MKQKKAAVPIVPLHEEVSFMQPVKATGSQLEKALDLAEKHEGGAVTYQCHIGKRIVNVKVWTVTT